MIKTPIVRFAAPALLVIASAALNSPARAQGAVGPGSVQLAFGYECGDRFLVRNEGAQPVALEWKASGSQDRSQMHLNATESREIASASSDAVELWVNGKLVATEPKGSKPCSANSGSDAAAGQSVVVRPLDANGGRQAGAGDPPSRVARLSLMQGGVTFQEAGSPEWGVATLNSSITTGDRLVSDDGGRAELQVGPLAVRLAPSTDLTVTNLTDGLVQLGVPQGTVRLSVFRMTPGDTVELDTPNGAVTVLAPGSYRISTDPSGEQTIVSVERGRVSLSGPELAQEVEQGRSVRLTAEGNAIRVANVPRPGPDGFDAWSSSRDALLMNSASASAAYVNPDIPGAQDLDANGRWDNDAVNGPVWYPTTVAVDWAPYRFGHWAWVEPWGWVWVDDAPWGFAPFHYGRWAFVGARWGWVPGPRAYRPYYSPALVAFADGGGFGVGIGVSAWFPLGPRDPFIPWYHHDDRYLRAVNRSNVRGITDVNVFVHVSDREHFPYAYRTRGMTVVPTATFAGGRPVGRDIVKVAPDRIAMAHLTPHPSVVPTHEAVLGGAIAPRPRIVAERPVAGLPADRRAVESPSNRRVPATPAGSPPALAARSSISASPHPVVTHNPAPPPNVPFEARQKAIETHPGRPLEPQQIQNLRAGKPAGPQRDPEPAHAAAKPAPKQPPKQAPKPAQHGDKKPK